MHGEDRMVGALCRRATRSDLSRTVAATSVRKILGSRAAGRAGSGGRKFE